MSDKLLEVKNLSVEYDTEISTVYAVNGLDLDLNYGETLGLVGETGAGKTTTALSVIQLLPEGIGFVTDGAIKLDGVDMLNAPEEKIRAMRGELTSPVDPAPGCRFAARCPYATDACRGRDIPLKEVEPGHFVSCTRF